MTAYKILDQQGSYFVTFTTVGWIDIFTRKECKDIIIDSLRYCMANKGLAVNAFVIMESHIHLVLTARDERFELSSIIRDFKKYTSKAIIQWIKNGNESRKEWLLPLLGEFGTASRKNKNYQVWQHNNHPILCLYPKFTLQKINYIHENPVKSGIVCNAQEYIYSSASNYWHNTGILDVSVVEYGVLEGLVMS